MNKFVKGIILMLGIILAGIQTPPVVWASVLLATVLVGTGYYVKNYLMPSVTATGQLSWQDVLSTIILAVVAALSDSLSALVVNGVIVWALVGKTALTTAIAYVTTTYFSHVDNPPKP